VTGGWGTPTNEAMSLGETYVAGKDQQTARSLLAACRALDLPTILVRTAARGFIVPDQVYEQYADDQAASHGI